MEPKEPEGEIHETTTLLPWYLNDTLSQAERRQVERHLAECVACQKELEELGRLRRAMQAAHSAHPDPSPDLFQRVRARIEMYEAEPRAESDAPAPSRSRWWKRIGDWLQSLFVPAWVPALATGLIVVQLAIIAGPPSKRPYLKRRSSALWPPTWGKSVPWWRAENTRERCYATCWRPSSPSMRPISCARARTSVPCSRRGHGW